MRPGILVAFSALMLGACGTEPSPGPLSGRFGGQLTDETPALLIASDTSVLLQLTCARITLTAPLIADSSGHFSASGSWLASTTLTEPAEVQGRLHGGTIEFTVTVIGPGPTLRWSGQLLRGVTPQFNT